MTATSMTLDQFLGIEWRRNYTCIWKKLTERGGKVFGYACEKCEEPSNRCMYYMPVCEMKEYIAVN